MIELQEHNGKLKIENYGLMEWATDVQTAVRRGYELDTSNEGYAQNFGSLYTCLMVESVSNPLAEEVQYLRNELKLLQREKTISGLALKVELDKEPQFATGGLLPKTEQVVGEEVFVIAPFDGTLPTTIEPKEVSTLVSDQKQESVDIHKEFLKDNTPDANQPAKRGPKPKNK